MSRYRFRPPLWAWIGLLPVFGLLVTLGSWQWHRGDWKTRLQADMDAAVSAPAREVTAALEPARVEAPIHLRARGRYLADRQVLLDNQPSQRRPGYHVWTPLRLDDGALLLVDRGWLPQGASLAVLPDLRIDAAETPREVTGLWRPLPKPGLRIRADNCASADAPWPRVLQYPTAEDLRCVYGEAPLSGVLLLDADAADGYRRDWRVGGGLPPQRHYAYALQWYAFAATLLALFVKLNLRKIR